MMQSISHWGQFEMQAAGTENFKGQLNKTDFERESVAWKLKQHKPTSFFVSRQDEPADPKQHPFY